MDNLETLAAIERDNARRMAQAETRRAVAILACEYVSLAVFVAGFLAAYAVFS